MDTQNLSRISFDPKPVPGSTSPIVVVHRRYLASVLRIADILEFDPERTPDIVFTHRSVTKGSEIFWHRDHYVQLHVDPNHKYVLLTAEPPNARVHRAVLDMATQLDSELALCQRLSVQAPFERAGPISLKHRWDLPSSVDRQIEPKANSYVYIDGAFRPNTQKLLGLLSGRELYGSPFVAVRELLQNAFDATKERIAREMLTANNPSSGKSVSSDRYCVELTLERDANGLLLICKDQGVGMSREIIENHFLVSGSAKRHEILELERRCEKVGLRLGRTGQFGIGVLSYFMIADKVMIETRRDNSCWDSEANGWIFETEGIGAFGELRKARTEGSGTTTTLRLRDDIVCGNQTEFVHSVNQYLHANVLRAPCVFRVRVDFMGIDQRFGPGWLRDTDALADLAPGRLNSKGEHTRDSKFEALSSSSKKRKEETSLYWREIAHEAKNALRWQTLTGELPSNSGAYRVSIPYFDLPRGLSFAFLRATELERELQLKAIGSGLAYVPQGHETTAWRGMQIDARTYHGYDWREYEGLGVREVDWEAPDVGRISVSREKMELSPNASFPAKWLRQKIAEEYERLASENAQGAFSALNYRLLGRRPAIGSTQQWRSKWDEPPSEPITWRSVVFPATVSQAFAYSKPPKELSVLGQSVSVVPALGELDDDDPYDGIGWNSRALQPDRLLVYTTYKTRLIPVWDQAPRQESFTDNPYLLTKFPDNWHEVLGAQLDHYSSLNREAKIWNSAHPLTRLFTRADWDWIVENAVENVDPLAVGDAILSTEGRAAAWLAITISERNQELWKGIIERDATFLRELWKRTFEEVERDKILKFFSERSEGIRLASPVEWTFDKEYNRWEKGKEHGRALNGDILPEVDSAWRLNSEEVTEMHRVSLLRRRLHH